VLGDVADFEAMLEATAGVDAIVHLALARIRRGMTEAERAQQTIDTDIRGVYNVYEAARINRVPVVIFASTNHVTGLNEQDKIVSRPEEPVRPDSIYGAGKAFGEALGRLYAEKYAQADPAKLDAERGVLARAPLVVAVASRAAPHPKIPEYEQLLSAGAVCMNLLTAAHAMGYAANWLTGWHAYDEDALRLLGVGPEERIAGFIHIGTASETPTDRPRPDVRSLVTRWQPVQG
jgi:nitroreductase